MPAKDYTAVKADPSVGAVLCGFDAFVSESERGILKSICPSRC